MNKIKVLCWQCDTLEAYTDRDHELWKAIDQAFYNSTPSYWSFPSLDPAASAFQLGEIDREFADRLYERYEALKDRYARHPIPLDKVILKWMEENHDED